MVKSRYALFILFFPFLLNWLNIDLHPYIFELYTVSIALRMIS